MLNSRGAVNAGMKQFMRLRSPMSHVPVAPFRIATAATHNDGSVAPIDIPKLAKMAQIKVSEQEMADWEPKIASIIDWFGQLQAVDVSGVAPAIHARDEGNVLRADEPVVCDSREAVMAQVPEQQGGFVRVPKISTGADTPTAASSTTSSMDSTASSATDSWTSSDEEPSSSSSTADVSGPISPEELSALQALDVRVGRIISCEQHPDADSLYVEKIDVGEAEPRTIVSGLVKYVPLQQMQNRDVIVLCNLKPRNMRGIKSFGMLLAASNDEHTAVEPLAPAPGAAPGSRVWFGQHKEQATPMEPNPLQKKKIWEGVQPVLRTNGAKVANFKGAVMQTDQGPVTAETLTTARIG